MLPPSRRSKLWFLAALLIGAGPLTAGADDITLEGGTRIRTHWPNFVVEETTSGAIFLLSVRPTASFFGTYTNDAFALRVNNTDVIRMNTLLRVGIGTGAPASKLHVVGDIRVSNGSFIDDGETLSVPDYVFADTYALMPLAELGEFVRRERHLPNVPSAEEVAEDGVDLGEFQMRLLEKVEELTLYLLEQDAHLRAQGDRIEELEGEIADLRAAETASR